MYIPQKFNLNEVFTQGFNQRNHTYQNTTKYTVKSNQNILSNLNEFQDNPPKMPQFR